MTEYRRALSDDKALEILGDYINFFSYKTYKYYNLNTKERVTIKYSRLYDDGVGYWFGIAPNHIEFCKNNAITHFVFILGYEGIINLPITILYKYINNADITYRDQTKSSVKHIHVRFKFNENIELYNKSNSWNLDDYYIYDQDIVRDDLLKKSKDKILEEAKNFKNFEKQYTESEKKSKSRKESKVQKERIAILEDHTCQVCGFCEEYLTEKGKKAWIIEVDHITDKSLGGGEDFDNLWVLCPNCHRKKTRGIIKIDKYKKNVFEKGKEIKIRNNHLDWY